MAEVFTVFYSWQSDTPQSHGRHLIREALDQAAESIGKDSTIPFRILVQSDTENEPGLCNIPETLLKRLRESDVIVSDLTFIAKTEPEEPKHCSNPNVLFELGYAFASLGPERLICVMNEVHGPAASQIFDLAHHRRPIAFNSPCEGKTRQQTIDSLAQSLENALRGVMKLGLSGGSGGDDEIRHQRQLSEIESYWQSTGLQRVNHPRISIWFRPKFFRPKRWPDAETLEVLIRRLDSNTGRNRSYPPQTKGNAPMDWGLYNDAYGDPWTLTYAGQFWTEIEIGGWEKLTLTQRDLLVSPERPDSPEFQNGEWVSGYKSLTGLGSVFRFLHLFSQEFADFEGVQCGFEVNGVRGKWINFGRNADSFGPCKSPRLQRMIEMTASEFRDQWLDQYANVGKDFLDLFYRDGRSWTREDVKNYITKPD